MDELWLLLPSRTDSGDIGHLGALGACGPLDTPLRSRCELCRRSGCVGQRVPMRIGPRGRSGSLGRTAPSHPSLIELLLCPRACRSILLTVQSPRSGFESGWAAPGLPLARLSSASRLTLIGSGTIAHERATQSERLHQLYGQLDVVAGHECCSAAGAQSLDGATEATDLHRRLGRAFGELVSVLPLVTSCPQFSKIVGRVDERFPDLLHGDCCQRLTERLAASQLSFRCHLVQPVLPERAGSYTGEGSDPCALLLQGSGRDRYARQ